MLGDWPSIMTIFEWIEITLLLFECVSVGKKKLTKTRLQWKSGAFIVISDNRKSWHRCRTGACWSFEFMQELFRVYLQQAV